MFCTVRAFFHLCMENHMKMKISWQGPKKRSLDVFVISSTIVDGIYLAQCMISYNDSIRKISSSYLWSMLHKPTLLLCDVFHRDLWLKFWKNILLQRSKVLNSGTIDTISNRFAFSWATLASISEEQPNAQKTFQNMSWRKWKYLHTNSYNCR